LTEALKSSTTHDDDLRKLAALAALTGAMSGAAADAFIVAKGAGR
jgi:hypothetical protein